MRVVEGVGSGRVESGGGRVCIPGWVGAGAANGGALSRLRPGGGTQSRSSWSPWQRAQFQPYPSEILISPGYPRTAAPQTRLGPPHYPPHMHRKPVRSPTHTPFPEKFNNATTPPRTRLARFFIPTGCFLRESPNFCIFVTLLPGKWHGSLSGLVANRMHDVHQRQCPKIGQLFTRWESTTGVDSTRTERLKTEEWFFRQEDWKLQIGRAFLMIFDYKDLMSKIEDRSL